MNIAIIDYGVGNVKSIMNALKKIGVDALLTKNGKEILDADGVILPGVGAFAHGMMNLSKYDLIDIIHQYTNTKKPFLGICLGMQMLFEESEEFGITKGLGLIEGKVTKLHTNNLNYNKLPHVSWNEIDKKDIDWDSTILEKVTEKSDVYFVHSFVAEPSKDENILATTMYSDYTFCSATKKDNIYGCQFHPEKSAEVGLQIMKNFVRICKESI